MGHDHADETGSQKDIGMSDDQYRRLLKDIHRELEDLLKPSNSQRLWDATSKILVLIVIGIGTMVVKHEVSVGRHEDRLVSHERRLDAMPPMWLRDDMAEIKQALNAYGTRLRAIEQKIK